MKTKIITGIFLILISLLTQAEDYKLQKGGISIGGLITVKFPTPQKIADTYNEQCNLQTIDTVGFPVMCQQFGSFVFYQGRDKITNLGLVTIITSGLDPFGLFSDDSLKKRVAIGSALMIAGATIVATCPPIPVDAGFHNLSTIQKLQQAQAFGYVPSAPPNFGIDVDNPANEQSCTATLDVSIDSNNREVTNFGQFSSRDFAYTSPFGSYPSASLDLAHIPAAFLNCNAALLSTIDISFGPSLSNNFSSFPGLPDVNLGSILGGLTDLILENIGLSEFEVVALSQFNSWKNNYRNQHPSFCTNNSCQYEHGHNRMTFYENMPANAWGNMTPKLEYYQDVDVMEYFNPVISALPLEVHLEALETGGVTVNAYPPRSFTGNPPADKHYTFDKSWLGIVDNCTAKSELKLDFPVASFYPLGNWDIPITLTDRVGNVTTGSMRIVVEDSIPPDLAPLDSVGIPVSDGTSVINFTDPGIGCVTNLCEGFPSTFYLHPPIYFDFASISPDVECYVDNVLGQDVACTVAQMPVNDISLVTWSIADPSGNVTETVQEVFVREQSFNQLPTVQDVTYTIGQNSQVQLPLSGNDADYDPLTFSIIDQPNQGGNLDAQVEAIFQTRFTTSGMIRSASGMIMVRNDNGERGLLLSVPDEKRLYLYSGALLSSGAEVVQRYDMTNIVPSAITFSRTKNIDLGSTNMNQVLKDANNAIWIGDWVNRKVYRYTYNNLTGVGVEKFIFNVPSSIQDPAGLVVTRNTNNDQFQVLIADRADNELWRSSVTKTTNNSNLANQSYGYNYSAIIGTTPFAVDAMDNWNSNNNLADTGEVLIASWSAKQMVWYDWDGGNGIVTQTWDISALVDDLDGPNAPGLPIMQDPRDFVLMYDSSTQMRIRLFDQAELKYTEKRFIKSNNTVICSGGTAGSPPIYCTNPERDVLRLPAMVNILAIEESNGLIYVLDKYNGGFQHLYRFDLAGRLDAVINLYDFAPSPSPLTTISQTEFVDLALKDNGDVVLLEKGNSGNTPSIQIVSVNSGVDDYYIQSSIALNMFGTNSTKALDVNATHIVVLMDTIMTLIPFNSTNSQTQIVASNAYNDISLSDTGEIYASNKNDAPINHITKFNINGGFIANIGAGDLDFNNDSNYGTMYFDNNLNKLWISDFANVFYPDLGASGEMHRMPRLSAYAADGTLLERLIPEGNPNDFFSFLQPGDFGTITSISAGPGRLYVAESAPLKRLHVFDTSEFTPVRCANLPVGEVCQVVGYTPTNGFVGTETFTYAAIDPFNANSNTATVTINVIDDQQAPVLVCPNNIELEKNDNSGFVANLSEPEKEPNKAMRNFLLGISVSENTDLPVVYATHNIPAALPLGNTTVIYSATDGSNNTGTCQTLITVVDTKAPVMSATSDLTVEATGLLTPFAATGIIQPTATDYSGYIISSDAPSEFPIGDTTITWYATDTQGNQSQQQQVITLADTTPPVFDNSLLANDIFASTITTPINYTAPQATDTVGVNPAGVVCSPKVGDLIAMGPNLVQCNVSDLYGNKATGTFVVNFYDVDAMNDGIVDVLQTGTKTFSDAANGGMTDGSIDFAENANWLFKVYEAPSTDTGITISSTFAPLRSQKGVANGVAHFCNNKIIMNNFDNETMLLDGISVLTRDTATITCTANGYILTSIWGNNDYSISLPDNSTATLNMPYTNTLIIDGWIATASSSNLTEITLNAPIESFHLQPGQSVNLQQNDLIFENGFE